VVYGAACVLGVGMERGLNGDFGPGSRPLATLGIAAIALLAAWPLRAVFAAQAPASPAVRPR